MKVNVSLYRWAAKDILDFRDAILDAGLESKRAGELRYQISGEEDQLRSILGEYFDDEDVEEMINPKVDEAVGFIKPKYSVKAYPAGIFYIEDEKGNEPPLAHARKGFKTKGEANKVCKQCNETTNYLAKALGQLCEAYGGHVIARSAEGHISDANHLSVKDTWVKPGADNVKFFKTGESAYRYLIGLAKEKGWELDQDDFFMDGKWEIYTNKN